MMRQAEMFAKGRARYRGVWGPWFSRWLRACEVRGLDVRVSIDVGLCVVVMTSDVSAFEYTGEGSSPEEAARVLRGTARMLIQERDDARVRKVVAA